MLRKFDDHKYYKTLSGYGLKGVDFIGILNNEQVYLIEVKNYKRRKKSPVPLNIGQILGERPPLIDAFIGKIEDTISAINVVQKFLLRKRTYRWSVKLWQWLPASLLRNSEWYFWTRVHDLVHSADEQLHLVLWLETEVSYPDLDATQLVRLHKLLETEIQMHFEDLTAHFEVASRKENGFGELLKVGKVVD